MPHGSVVALAVEVAKSRAGGGLGVVSVSLSVQDMSRTVILSPGPSASPRSTAASVACLRVASGRGSALGRLPRSDEFVETVAYAPSEVLDVETSTNTRAVVVHVQRHVPFGGVLSREYVRLIFAHGEAAARTDKSDARVVHRCSPCVYPARFVFTPRRTRPERQSWRPSSRAKSYHGVSRASLPR